MPHQCAGRTTRGTQCSRQIADDRILCWQHAEAVPAVPAAGAAPAVLRRGVHQCEGILRTRHRCTHRARDGHFCGLHQVFPRLGIEEIEVEIAREARYTAMIAHVEFLDAIERGERTMNENAYLDSLTNFLTRDNVFRNITFTVAEQIRQERGFLNHHRGQLAFHDQHADAAPHDGIRGIANDAQSIHRREVSDQTNAFLHTLFAENSTNLYEDRWDMVTSWIGATVGGELRRDMKKWYKQSFCKIEGDFLYRRTLNAVVDYARPHKEHEELRKRIYDECTESVGMCCEGHIARLCNALVGFHDDAGTAVAPSASETLQDRFAALAAREGTAEEGRAILTELAVPADQWDAWLSAL